MYSQLSRDNGFCFLILGDLASFCWAAIASPTKWKDEPRCYWRSFPTPVFQCEPMDCSLSGSSVCEISQARILEWVVISAFRGSSWPRVWTHISYIVDSLLNCRWMLYHWNTREGHHNSASKKSCLGKVDVLGWPKSSFKFFITAYRKSWTNF